MTAKMDLPENRYRESYVDLTFSTSIRQCPALWHSASNDLNSGTIITSANFAQNAVDGAVLPGYSQAPQNMDVTLRGKGLPLHVIELTRRRQQIARNWNPSRFASFTAETAHNRPLQIVS